MRGHHQSRVVDVLQNLSNGSIVGQVSLLDGIMHRRRIALLSAAESLFNHIVCDQVSISRAKNAKRKSKRSSYGREEGQSDTSSSH